SPGEQDIPQTRSDRRRELDRADAAHRFAGDAEVVEHVEVFQEGGLDVDRQRVDLATVFGRRDLELFIGQRRYIEELRNPLAPFDFPVAQPTLLPPLDVVPTPAC